MVKVADGMTRVNMVPRNHQVWPFWSGSGKPLSLCFDILCTQRWLNTNMGQKKHHPGNAVWHDSPLGIVIEVPDSTAWSQSLVKIPKSGPRATVYQESPRKLVHKMFILSAKLIIAWSSCCQAAKCCKQGNSAPPTAANVPSPNNSSGLMEPRPMPIIFEIHGVECFFVVNDI